MPEAGWLSDKEAADDPQTQGKTHQLEYIHALREK